MSLIVGIDPGLTGAIGVIDWQNNGARFFDMPICSRGMKKAKVNNKVDGTALSEIFDKIETEGRIKEVVIEQVSSMTKQGVATVFSLGHTAGVIQGVIEAMGYELTYVTPQRWKREMGLADDSKKTKALALARKLYPAMSLDRKKDHNRAEAVLIALWRATDLGLQGAH